jgi:hypothetical protein
MGVKLNCWEFKRCGREPNGMNAQELGVCEAALETRVDGANEGHNAGRACWAVAGTLCGGKVQGTYATKMATCTACEFFDKVIREQGAGFDHTVLQRLR